jgi:phosphatidate phosphatase APP1
MRYALGTIPEDIKKHADWFIFRLKQRYGLLDVVSILPYRGHGTSKALYLKGRVLEKKGIMPSSSQDSVWRNLRNMYRRFSSNAIPNAHVRAHFRDIELEVVTDQAGYFDLCIEPRTPLDDQQVWYEIELELVSPHIKRQGPVHATGHVLVPPASARFGMISDIDDTVVRTAATDLLQMLWIVLLNNAHTRLPFPGIAEFYQALQRGKSGDENNPIFYVSSSPWNIYDLLVEFLDVHGLPVDPLFLRNWREHEGSLRKMDHKQHKLELIETLIETYPHLPFVLIGDSGQEDPEIYQRVVHDFPGRILAIYIRDVTEEQRADEVCAIADHMSHIGVDMLLDENTITAAEHAAANGLIASSALPSIRADKAKDEDQSLQEKMINASIPT